MAFLVLSGFIFLGLFQLQNTYFSGKAEQQLKRENAALRMHQEKLTAELDGAAADLNELISAEEAIYRQIYLTDRGKDNSSSPSPDLSGIDLTEFTGLTEQMIQKASIARQSARTSNAGFSELYWPDKTDARELQQYPTLPPLEGLSPERLACGFGTKVNPFNKQQYRHTGLDLLAERGTPVLAAAAGRVVETGRNDGPGGQGNFLVIDHGNGYRSRYAMLESINVFSGKTVRQGEVVATIGLSGSSIAPHLHFEIWKNGAAVNPAAFMVQGLDAGKLASLLEAGKQTKQSLD